MTTPTSDEVLACTQCGSGHYLSEIEQLEKKLQIATEALKWISENGRLGRGYVAIEKSREALTAIEQTQ